MTRSIPIGPATQILQNITYALPGRAVFLTALAAVEVSLDGSTWAVLADSTTGAITGSVFVRCTTGNTTVVCADVIINLVNDVNLGTLLQVEGLGIQTPALAGQVTILNGGVTLSIDGASIRTTNSSLSLTVGTGGSIFFNDDSSPNNFLFDPAANKFIISNDEGTIEWAESGTEISDMAGVLTFAPEVSTVFGNEGIEFSDFSIHPQSDDNASVGLADKRFSAVYTLAINTDSIARDSGDLTISTTTSGNIDIIAIDLIRFGGAGYLEYAVSDGELRPASDGDGILGNATHKFGNVYSDLVTTLSVHSSINDNRILLETGVSLVTDQPGGVGGAELQLEDGSTGGGSATLFGGSELGGTGGDVTIYPGGGTTGGSVIIQDSTGTPILTITNGAAEFGANIVAGGAPGISTSITTGALVGKTITVTNGLITGFA